MLIIKLHKNNPHKKGYNFENLIQELPELSSYVIVNKYGKTTIDFSNPAAVKTFNKALLKKYYHIDIWDIPEGYLCPPVPSRVDYLYYIRDLVNAKSSDKSIKILDIGTGANCIYPLLGAQSFKWKFVGTEIDKKALGIAKSLVEINNLNSRIELRWQKNNTTIFEHVIGRKEYFNAVICNPPFFESKEQAHLANIKKWKKLGFDPSVNQNFGGTSNELWCSGGAFQFISKMIIESKKYKEHFGWISVLVAKGSHLEAYYKILSSVKAEYQIIEMEHGHKKSRILCWKFL